MQQHLIGHILISFLNKNMMYKIFDFINVGLWAVSTPIKTDLTFYVEEQSYEL